MTDEFTDLSRTEHRDADQDRCLDELSGSWPTANRAPPPARSTKPARLARAAGLDPVAFRLANLPPGQDRLRRVLERVAGMAKWPGRRSTREIGYGVACGVYKEMSFAAVVAEVALEAGRYRVRRLWCAVRP